MAITCVYVSNLYVEVKNDIHLLVKKACILGMAIGLFFITFFIISLVYYK